MAGEGHPRETLLVFSDVHLGSDISDGAHRTLQRSAAIDRDLVALLTHYREQALPAGRWRVVIAGDFIDFIGMTIKGDASLTSELTTEERAHGLGNSEDHTREKLRRVALRHADVFAALSAFVAEGHALTLIHGNHDIELHWDGVKDDFRALLWSHAQASRSQSSPASSPASPPTCSREEFLARIEFAPWFFYRDGVAFIEHGHQYDPFCSTMHVMSPLSPLDPRRVARGFSEVLLRFVVRPTRGMTEHGHESFGMIDYLAFGARLGVSGMMSLGVRFVRAIVELFRLRRAQLSRAESALRKEHERRVAQLAHVTRLGKERLVALMSLQARPITSTVRGIMQSLLLDRAAVATGAFVLLALSLLFGRAHPLALVACIAAVVSAWGALHWYFGKQRSVDPGAALMERARQVSALFPAAFVVMGHTHMPEEAAAGSATYINLGSWAEEEPTAGESPMHAPSRAARTHLVIEVNDDGKPTAQLRAWDAVAGAARRLVAGHDEASSSARLVTTNDSG